MSQPFFPMNSRKNCHKSIYRSLSVQSRYSFSLLGKKLCLCMSLNPQSLYWNDELETWEPRKVHEAKQFVFWVPTSWRTVSLCKALHAASYSYANLLWEILFDHFLSIGNWDLEVYKVASSLSVVDGAGLYSQRSDSKASLCSFLPVFVFN